MMRYLAVLVGLALVACGGSDLKAEGEECVASSECMPGLTCNFGETPHVCRTMQTPKPDASPNAPDASPNAPDANPNQPDANPNQPDAMPGTPDAAVPDAAVPDAAVPDAAVPDAA